MKTPRDLLLQRHKPADQKLDAIRHKTVAAVCDRRPVAAVCDRRPTFNDFLLSLRWHFAAMSAVWLIALFLSIDHSPTIRRDSSMAKQKAPSTSQLLACFRENRRMLLEMIGPSAPEPAVAVPPRRSALELPIAYA